MPRLLPHALAAALAFAAPAFASGAVTKAQVLGAIRTFESNASETLTSARPTEQIQDAMVRSSDTIIRFALESDDVVVDLGADSVPWCDVKKGLAGITNSGARGLMLAAYLSGSVKAQLGSGKQDPNPYPGWVAMLRLYRVVKMREGTEIPEVEALLARQMNGSLQDYAAEAVRRSTDSLQKAYGAGGTAEQAKAGSRSLASQP